MFILVLLLEDDYSFSSPLSFDEQNEALLLLMSRVDVALDGGV